MKKKTYNQNVVIRGALRRAFARSPVVQEAMQASRKEEPRYNKDGSRHKRNWVKRQCQVCDQWVPTSKIAVDHIDPVVSVDEGFQDWNIFVDRLWCAKDNLQRICDDCHQKKTNAERFARSYKQELEHLAIYEVSKDEEAKKFVKKFVKKRIQKYPYPQEFVDRIVTLRRHFKMKV